jgi:hypothetical protein
VARGFGYNSYYGGFEVRTYRTLATKHQLLEDAGYIYNFDRQVYVNRKTKKVVSVNFVEDHDEAEIDKFIRQETDGKHWMFKFNDGPAPAVQRELESVLG